MKLYVSNARIDFMYVCSWKVLGTAFSLGCTVNGQPPGDIQKEIDEGKITIPDE